MVMGRTCGQMRGGQMSVTGDTVETAEEERLGKTQDEKKLTGWILQRNMTFGKEMERPSFRSRLRDRKSVV